MTLVIQKAEQSQQLLQHINTEDLHISSLWRNWTKRDLYHSWTPWFLQVPPTPSLLQSTESQHRDQYLHCDSNHVLVAKHSVFNTLTHRAKVVSTHQQSCHTELEHIRKALQASSFPLWALNNLQHKFNCKDNIHNGQNSTGNQPNNNNNNNGTNHSNNNN